MREERSKMMATRPHRAAAHCSPPLARDNSANVLPMNTKAMASTRNTVVAYRGASTSGINHPTQSFTERRFPTTQRLFIVTRSMPRVPRASSSPAMNCTTGPRSLILILSVRPAVIHRDRPAQEVRGCFSSFSRCSQMSAKELVGPPYPHTHTKLNQECAGSTDLSLLWFYVQYIRC